MTQTGPAQEATGTYRLLCPHCGSDDVRKVSLMYEQATSNMNLRMVSMNDQGGAAYTAGSGGLQNLMGGRIAPPAAPVQPASPPLPVLSSIWTALVLLFMAHIASVQGARFWSMPSSMSLLEWIWAGFSLLLCFPAVVFWPRYWARRRAYTRAFSTYVGTQLPDYQARMAIWSRTWMCTRCGGLFEKN